MSGGLTEAKSLRRLTQAFRMAALCCSLGSVTVTQPPGKHSIPRGCIPKSLFPNFGTPTSDPMQPHCRAGPIECGTISRAFPPSRKHVVVAGICMVRRKASLGKKKRSV
jgi:hypothetical protein